MRKKSISLALVSILVVDEKRTQLDCNTVLTTTSYSTSCTVLLGSLLMPNFSQQTWLALFNYPSENTTIDRAPVPKPIKTMNDEHSGSASIIRFLPATIFRTGGRPKPGLLRQYP